MIDELTAVLPTAVDARPLRTVRVEVFDRHRQIVVRVEQPAVGCDDAVPVGVGVVARPDLVRLAVGDQRRHRIGRAAVHPDLAVGVQRHEPPCRVDQRIDHREVEVVPFGDRTPVVDAGAAQRVGADADLLGTDGVDVDHVRQVVDVGVHVVVALRGLQGTGQRDPLHGLEPVAQDLVGAFGDHARRVGVGGSAVGRVVLETAVAGRIVRRGDDDAVGQVAVAATVERQDGVADRGRRRVPVGRVDHRHDVVGRQHLQRRHPGRFGQRMGVAADEQRAGSSPAPSGTPRWLAWWPGCAPR